MCTIKKRIAQVIMDDYVGKTSAGRRHGAAVLFRQIAVRASKDIKAYVTPSSRIIKNACAIENG